MPKSGAEGRAKQLSLLRALIHKKSTDSKFVEAVNQLSESASSLSEDQRVDLLETKRTIDREQKLPTSFVVEKTALKTLTYAKWIEAKKEKKFSLVKKELKKLVELLRQEVQLIGYTEHPYDALFNQYEPFLQYAQVKPLLLDLSLKLKELLLVVSARQEKLKISNKSLSIDLQQKLCQKVAEKLGFSFLSGRLDPTEHPFKTSIGPSDIRICTRYDENDYTYSLYSTLHEVGHALYDQGLPLEHAGRPRGSAISLSIHESQSRLWENMVGRSSGFVDFLYGLQKEIFPKAALAKNSTELFCEINLIEPGTKRIQADEVSYSLHIVVRTLLEEQLITAKLEADDLPAAWNAMYAEHLGVTPADDAQGLMQDVHWFKGDMGYFPTYALGNMFAAQMMEVATVELGDLEGVYRKGEFDLLRTWLNKNVHQHGMLYGSDELIKKISGKSLSAEPFLKYLTNKFAS